MTKILAVQLQPELLAGDASDIVIRELETLANDEGLVSQVKFIHGEDNGKYINVEFECSDVVRLWNAIKEQLFTRNPMGSIFKNGAVVVCQGDSGWDDYLLLHHYDSSVQLDEVAPSKGPE